MITRERSTGICARALRAAVSLTLAVCLLFSMIPLALAGTSVGQYPSSVGASSVKTYIKLSKAVVFFSGDTYGTGTTVAPSAGLVFQLVSDNFYTHPTDNNAYFGVYYMNQRYNVLRSDVVGDIMTDAEVLDYIKSSVWNQIAYATLRSTDNLVGDIRVHAVQYALNQLGYTVVIDGNYGDKTADEVRKFQRANRLDTDGSAGPLTQTVLFSLASGGTISGGGGTISGGGTTGSGSTVTAGTLTTKVSVNLRKSTSISSQRLAVVPKKIKFTYTDTAVKNGVTWYRVTYNGFKGWLMGSFVTVGSTSSGAGSNATAIGSVTIILPSTRVRKTPNGAKSGIVLSKGTVVDLLAQPTTTAGFAWYQVRTSSGVVGYVRGDCATPSINTGTGGGGVATTDKTFIMLPKTTALFTTQTRPTSGTVSVSAGTVLQMVNAQTYTISNVTYCSLYFNNTTYNAVYSDVSAGIMSSSELGTYVSTLWSSTLNGSLKQALNLVGDVRVYALQVALNQLGYYTGNLDGSFGSGTQSAVRNFQRKTGLTVDGACGNETWVALTALVKGSTGGGSTGGGSTGGGTTVADFGTINSVERASWSTDDNGASLIKKGTYASIMDVGTGKVFSIYRWSGGSHADCVPASAADTKIMCEIVGFPYNASAPNSSQLSLIKADGNKSAVSYTWPDFKNKFGSGKNIGSAWDRRPALLNVDGRVFAVSIYGFPHGFNGTDSFSKSKFPGGSYFYETNNYYGMMCIHFVGSTSHSGTTPDTNHQNAINTAYNYAKQLWPTLCK